MKREGFGFGIGEEAEKENLACENHHLMKEREKDRAASDLGLRSSEGGSAAGVVHLTRWRED